MNEEDKYTHRLQKETLTLKTIELLSVSETQIIISVMATWVGHNTRREKEIKGRFVGSRIFPVERSDTAIFLLVLQTPRGQLISIAIKKLLHFYLFQSHVSRQSRMAAIKHTKLLLLWESSLSREEEE